MGLVIQNQLFVYSSHFARCQANPREHAGVFNDEHNETLYEYTICLLK